MKLSYPHRLSGQEWEDLRQQIFARDGRKCLICGSEERLHVHHRLPLSQGGTNHPDNLEARCKNHHFDKHPWMRFEL